jgi:hypothetical protein
MRNPFRLRDVGEVTIVQVGDVVFGAFSTEQRAVSTMSRWASLITEAGEKPPPFRISTLVVDHQAARIDSIARYKR